MQLLTTPTYNQANNIRNVWVSKGRAAVCLHGAAMLMTVCGNTECSDSVQEGSWHAFSAQD